MIVFVRHRMRQMEFHRDDWIDIENSSIQRNRANDPSYQIGRKSIAEYADRDTKNVKQQKKRKEFAQRESHDDCQFVPWWNISKFWRLELRRRFPFTVRATIAPTRNDNKRRALPQTMDRKKTTDHGDRSLHESRQYRLISAQRKDRDQMNPILSCQLLNRSKKLL